MKAEVISIGDELTSGQRVDTNTAWLSQRLAELGFLVHVHTTVADDLPAMVAAIRLALQRSQMVLVNGGLGPTADDLTREALAAAADVPLVLDEDQLRQIEARFHFRGRQMPASNRLQAMFPQGSQPIPNPHGTAPGIDMTVERDACRLFALPGVPAELFEMWDQTVEPRLGAVIGNGRVIRHRRIKCFGMGESQIEEKLPDLIRRDRHPTVGITVHCATISLRITAMGETEQQCEAMMQPTIETIGTCLGDLVFGEDDDELQHVVARLLRKRGQTLATAECGTAGRLAHWLSDLPESAAVYRGGLVAAPDTASDLLANSRQLAESGALSCRGQFGADYALAIGPIPPQGHEPAEFHYALATTDGVTVQTGSTAGHPAILKDRAAKQALNFLRTHLLQRSFHRS